jgi:hypothetical protein
MGNTGYTIPSSFIHEPVSPVITNDPFQIYGQVNRLVQPLESSTLVGGYQAHGSGEHLPPKGYTYSDTGMFQDPNDGTRSSEAKPTI